MAWFASVRQQFRMSCSGLHSKLRLHSVSAGRMGLALLCFSLGATGAPVLAQDAASEFQKTPELTPQLAQELSPPIQGLDGTYSFLQTFPTSGQIDSPFWDAVDESTVLTDEMISDTTMSIPSLWYNRDQMPGRLGGRRLINSWTAYRMNNSDMAVVDVVINAQYWSVLNYLEQYGVLNHLGNSAKDYGYNLRVYRGAIYNRELLGLYVCDFSALSPSAGSSQDSLPLIDRAEQVPCKASLDMFSIRGYQGTSDSLIGD